MGPVFKCSNSTGESIKHKPLKVTPLCLLIMQCVALSSSREKPQDDEWAALKRHQVPLLLNFSQCKLSLEEYKPVIDHCTEVLDFEPGELLST